MHAVIILYRLDLNCWMSWPRLLYFWENFSPPPFLLFTCAVYFLKRAPKSAETSKQTIKCLSPPLLSSHLSWRWQHWHFDWFLHFLLSSRRYDYSFQKLRQERKFSFFYSPSSWIITCFSPSSPSVDQLSKQNTHRNQNSKYFDRNNKHSTMSRTHLATLPNLPLEIIHRIFDNLDGTTVLLSVRNVCLRLRANVGSYYRYELDFSSLSKRDFHWLIFLIHPESVTGITLNDRGTTPRQIAVFRSLIDIDLFTQLRSLTLLKIKPQDLCPFLQHATRCSLTSLTLDSNWHKDQDQQQIAQYLSSIIDQSTFVRLQLLSKDLCMLIYQVKWPIQCKLKYLRLGFVTQTLLCKIVLHAPRPSNTRYWPRNGIFFPPLEWYSRNVFHTAPAADFAYHLRSFELLWHYSIFSVLDTLSSSSKNHQQWPEVAERIWLGRVHQIESNRTEKVRVLYKLLSLSTRGRHYRVDATCAEFSILYAILDGGEAMVG